MLHYCRDIETATAETAERAAYLEARGYVRCSAAAHAELWKIRNIIRRRELEQQHAPNTPAPTPEPAIPHGFRLFRPV